MSGFFAGQDVVCVDDSGTGMVQAGTHYRVEWVYGEFLALVGVIDAHGLRGMFARRFRPTKPESIEIFREMCRTVKRSVDA